MVTLLEVISKNACTRNGHTVHSQRNLKIVQVPEVLDLSRGFDYTDVKANNAYTLQSFAAFNVLVCPASQ